MLKDIRSRSVGNRNLHGDGGRPAGGASDDFQRSLVLGATGTAIGDSGQSSRRVDNRFQFRPCQPAALSDPRFSLATDNFTGCVLSSAARVINRSNRSAAGRVKRR